MIRSKITEFRMDHGDHAGLTCAPPCSLYSVLAEHDLIPDPYAGLNVDTLAELASVGATFRAEFGVSSAQLGMKNQILRLGGLDTVCAVYVNGDCALRADNMHRVYDIDLKGRIHLGQNELRIEFTPAASEMERRQTRSYLHDDPRAAIGASQLRKAAYASGWDFGPGLMDMGILGEIELICYDKKIIDYLTVTQTHGDDGVRLDFHLHTVGRDDMSRAVITVVSPASKVYYCGLADGKGSVTITQPNLWWPAGLGPQNLYRLSVNLYSGTELEDTREMNLGLRSLTLNTDGDIYGRAFAFTVNGQPFFGMGACYVPEDGILPKCTKERTRALLTACRDANHNMIRVWGGGLYPPDYFYDLCDELGLVVWQDMAVCGGDIRLDDGFEENYLAEFSDNLKRIGTHPCLGLICGRCEISSSSDTDELSDDYRVGRDRVRLFEELLPELAERITPQASYSSSTPLSDGRTDDLDSDCQGDAHYRLPAGGDVTADIESRLFRFCSQVGLESIPSLDTVRSFAEDGAINLFSPVMERHRSAKGGNLDLVCRAASEYLYADTAEDLVYMTQTMQMRSIRRVAEHLRKRRGQCMGLLYWQLNDCWPGITCSGIDYYGRWKALHYGSRRFFAPVLAIAEQSGGRVEFSVSNEQRHAYAGTLTYELMDNRNRLIHSASSDFEVDAMSARDILTEDFSDLIEGHASEYYLRYSVRCDQTVSSAGTLLFVKPREFCYLEPNFDIKLTGNGNDFTLEIEADVYADTVSVSFEGVDAILEDNWFDITSSTPTRVKIRTDRPVSVEALRRSISLKSVYDIGRSRRPSK